MSLFSPLIPSLNSSQGSVLQWGWGNSKLQGIQAPTRTTKVVCQDWGRKVTKNAASMTLLGTLRRWKLPPTRTCCHEDEAHGYEWVQISEGLLNASSNGLVALLSTEQKSFPCPCLPLLPSHACLGNIKKSLGKFFLIFLPFFPQPLYSSFASLNVTTQEFCFGSCLVGFVFLVIFINSFKQLQGGFCKALWPIFLAVLRPLYAAMLA